MTPSSNAGRVAELLQSQVQRPFSAGYDASSKAPKMPSRPQSQGASLQMLDRRRISGTQSAISLSSGARTQGIRPGTRANFSRVSSAAELLNQTAQRQLLVVNHQFSSGRGTGIHERKPSTISPLARAKAAGTSGILEDQEFQEAAAQLTLSIDEIRIMQEKFDPSERGQMSPKGGRSGGGPAGKRSDLSLRPGLSVEETETLRERLQIYKMCRKVEPELPPLSRDKLADSPGKPVVDQTMLWRNAAPEAVNCWWPERRKERILVEKEQRAERHRHAEMQRQDSITSICLKYSETLARKHQQAETVVALRRSKAKLKDVKKDDFSSDRWLTFFASISFVQRLSEDLKLKKMSAGEAHNSEEARELLARRGGLLRVAASMIMANKRIKERRKQGKVLCNCLGSWKYFGRIFLSFKQVTNNVVRLQRWWHRTTLHLKEARNRIAVRWVILERAELAKELNKADPIPKGPPSRRGSAQAPKLSLEEKINLEMLDEALRLRCIENELRERRFHFLPELQTWEGEIAAWRAEHQAWLEQNKASLAMGSEEPLTPFQWPPVRPSYLPPDRLRRQQGDEHILAMWRAARRSKGTCTDFGSGKDDKNARNLADPKSEPARPFGEEAADEELARWGADPAAMPGLTDADGGVRHPLPC
ncbi:unnamed protein product [Polarella glacialis]|uniref:Uncharacterized protein n=1 Tax=Polarella glacialis TaxID=89957 RepID=A0A813H3D1_POLGL|nr:unnamed protein product [Polarella glacialis]